MSDLSDAEVRGLVELGGTIADCAHELLRRRLSALRDRCGRIFTAKATINPEAGEEVFTLACNLTKGHGGKCATEEQDDGNA